MNAESGLIDALIEGLAILRDLLWTLFATTLDAARMMGPLTSAITIAMALGVMFGVAVWMQHRHNTALGDDPDTPVNLWWQELLFTAPGLIVRAMLWPFAALGRLANYLQATITAAQKDAEEAQDDEEGMFADLDASSEESDAAPQEPAPAAPPIAQAEPLPDAEDAPVLAASLGPSFMGAAVLTAAYYVLGLLTEPLVRLQLGLADGLPAYEYLLLGDRPELQWYIPLSDYPWMGGVLTAFFWMTLWWWTARIIRLVLFRTLCDNLIAQHHDAAVLPWWRTWFGASEVWRPDVTYLRWAKWLPLASAPFLIGSFLMLAGDPYRMSPSMFSISLLLTFGWAIHLYLEGVLREEPEEEPEEETSKAPLANHWEDVLRDVQERTNIRPPHVFEPPRPIEPLAMSSIDPASEGIVSPLLTELLPEPQTFTHMQYTVLREISLHGFVHTDPPMPQAELDLSPGAAGPSSTDRHRNQIVLAPEGAGKSTLAMLAACNHAIMHTRCSLIVTHDDAAAQRLYGMIQRAIEPSTLRWNIRERRVGGDLVTDLAQGIIPDILVCSLRQLVVNILEETSTYAPLLENLGLIIVDDIESFCGPIELHAQLAFRRLNMRVNELLGVEALGAEHALMTLILGADSMHDSPAWIRTLCGVDAVARYFDYSHDEASAREAALMKYRGMSRGAAQEEGQGEEAPTAQSAMQEPHQLIYRLHDLRNSDGEVLPVTDIIASCERLAVPWHYRRCGDMRRGTGRQSLLLRDEPKYVVDSPLDAAVVFLEGHWSEVRREIARLRRAGARFDPTKPTRPNDVATSTAATSTAATQPAAAVPIALITIIDRDEEMALTEFNVHSTLTDALTSLPRPVVRSPIGRVVLEHLSAELTSNWLEVEQVLDIFGNSTARLLTQLADAGMLMSEQRVDLDEEVQRYEARVYVRATSRALSERRPTSQHSGAREPLLPPRVSQVRLASGDKVAVRDRTSLNLIEVADAASADHVYYMGRIFENARGRFVVVGRGTDADPDEAGEVIEEDVLVEPYLGDGVSSPRRRTYILHTGADEALRRVLAEDATSTEHERPTVEPVLIGDFPVATSLSDVTCVIDHIATYRLGARHGEVRQRILFDAERRRAAIHPIHTTALGLYPNPEVDFELSEDPPALRLEEARLIAAAMRAVLPTMYRGAQFSLSVDLHVDAPSPTPDHVFSPHEGFFFYDPQPGGNGAARALHRDGVELLLRLVRVYLERVLYHDRLRSRYDHWGDDGEVVAGQADGAPEADEARGTWFMDMQSLDVAKQAEPDEDAPRSTSPAQTSRQRDRAIRKRALVWLDSRLRPEGSLSGGRRVGSYGSGSEEGEGDLWDIGRCWYARDGSITDLLWTKHRWRLDEAGGEAMVDVGFDRDTAARSRAFGPESAALQPLLKAIAAQRDNAAFALEDQTVWGTPRTLWTVEAGSEIPSGTAAGTAQQQPMLDYQLFVAAIAAHDMEALKPLALLLKERSWTDAEDVQGRYALIDYITRFVQGIPTTAISTPRGGAMPPVHTLLHRLGDADSKSLVLAILLHHCGFDTGLFVSLTERHALCAVAVAEGGRGDQGDPSATTEVMRQWREAVDLSAEDALWAELPARPGGPPGPLMLYVPVETCREVAPGTSRAVREPNEWAFVPLEPAWFATGKHDVVEDEEADADPEEDAT